MEENIFKILWKSKPNRIKPKENFFTNALTYLLNTDEKFQYDFVKLLKNIKIPYKFHAESQSSYPRYKSYIDIEIVIEKNAEKLTFLIEAKIDSGQSKGQLEKYLEIVGEEYIKKGQKASVFYLTRPYNSEEGIPQNVNFLTWDKIYKIASISNNKLTKQFTKFMEENKMGYYDGLRKKDLTVGESYLEFEKRCKGSLNGVWDSYKSKKFKVSSTQQSITGNTGMGIKLKKNGITCGLAYWLKTDEADYLEYPLKNGLYLCIWFENPPKSLKRKLVEAKNKDPKYWDWNSDSSAVVYNHFELPKKVIGNVKPNEQKERIRIWFNSVTKGLLG